jgi:hypothetical protein
MCEDHPSPSPRPSTNNPNRPGWKGRPWRPAPATLVILLLGLSVAPLPGSGPGLAQEAPAAESWLTRLPLTGCLKLSHDGKECAEPVLYTQPRPLSWQGLTERFHLAERIPPSLPEDLKYTTGALSKKEIVTIDLGRTVPEWLALEFRAPRFGQVEQWAQSVGNILQAFSGTKKTLSAEQEALDKLRTTYPHIWEEVKEFLPEWVKDDFLYSSAWDPSKTGSPEAADNDGILERPPLLMRAGVARSGYSTPAKDRKIFQASAPIYAPLETIITAENAFRDYPRQAGSNYQEVYPIKDTYFAGMDPDGRPFTLYDVSFTQKPFMLATLSFVLRQFIHYEGDRLVMENLLLKGDMNYLRLKIFYDPIRTTEGSVIGYVKTELLDVDVKSLPMSDKDRSAGARGDVGNIKRAAEALRRKAPQ